MNRRHLLIALAAIALAAAGLNGLIGPNGDDAAYVMFAQGLLRGQGLVETCSPIPEPSHFRTFTLPLLLLPFELLVPGQWLLYKVVPFTAFVLLALLLTRWGAMRHRTLWLALTLFNPYLIEYAGLILTEIPYLLLSLLLLRALSRWSRRGHWLRLLPLALGLYFLIHTKELGYALLGALVLFALLHPQRRRALWVVALVLAFLATDYAVFNLRENIYLFQTRMENQYDPGRGTVTPLSFALRCGRRVLEYALNRFPDFFLLPYFHGIDPHLPDGSINPRFALKALPGLLLALLIGRGWWLSARRRRALPELYLLLYAGILVAWQSGLPRYLIPVAPLLFLYLVRGAGGLPRPRLWYAAGILLVLLQVTTAAQMVYTARTQPLLPHWAAYYRASQYAAQLPPDTVIACRKPGITYLLAGRHAVPYPLTDRPADLQATVARFGVTHILVDELATGGLLADRYLRPALAGSGLRTRVLYHDGGRTELRAVENRLP